MVKKSLEERLANFEKGVASDLGYYKNVVLNFVNTKIKDLTDYNMNISYVPPEEFAGMTFAEYAGKTKDMRRIPMFEEYGDRINYMIDHKKPCYTAPKGVRVGQMKKNPKSRPCLLPEVRQFLNGVTLQYKNPETMETFFSLLMMGMGSYADAIYELTGTGLDYSAIRKATKHIQDEVLELEGWKGISLEFLLRSDYYMMERNDFYDSVYRLFVWPMSRITVPGTKGIFSD